MKKTLAIILALALVFSSFTFAFAEETLPVDAASCETLGMLQGGDAGMTLDYLKTAPTRIQAAIMVLRLKGLEDEALAFTGVDNFADADQSAWAKPIMAYLKATPSVGFAGVGDNNFNPTGLIDVKSFYKVMLETLGYKQTPADASVINDFTFENTLTFAAEKGLKKVAEVTNFTIADVATATVEALKATVKGSEVTLAEKLVADKVITAAAAEKAGVYTPEPEVLAVESVKVTNLKETVVTFNKEVDEDSAESSGNYELDEDSIDGSVSLNDDKKSVTITWDNDDDDDNELENQTEYDLTIDGVTDLAGNELAEVTVTFLANDVATPVAESLTLVGPNKLKLVFSEPINSSDLYVDDYEVVIEDEDFDYEVSELVFDGNEVMIELNDEELEEGDYSVEISGFRDYADLKNLKKTFTLDYEIDTTAPVATIKSATQTKVVVEFNKPVYNGDPDEEQKLTTDFFYHTYSSYNPVYIEVSEDNEEFTLYFTAKAANAVEEDAVDEEEVTDRPLSEGSVKFTVVADGDDNITDEWGNEVEDNITLNVSITSDETAPTVTKITVEEQDEIRVYFSEPVDAEDTDYYTIVDEDGDDVDVDGVDYNDEDDYVTLTFDTELEGEYSMTIEDVVDLSLEENEISKVTKKFEVKDENAPSLSTGDVAVVGVDSGVGNDDDDYIYVTFEEDMATSGTYSVLDKDNYQLIVDGHYVDLKDDDKIATYGGNDRIRIALDNEDEDIENLDVESGDISLVIGRVADALGNKVENFNEVYIVRAEDSPAITHVVTLDEKLIEITILGELKSVNKKYFSVTHNLATPNTADIYSIKTWEVDDGETIITAVLPSSLALNSSADTDLIVKMEEGLETISGTDIGEFTFGDGVDEDGNDLSDELDEVVEDGYAPSIVDDDDEDVFVQTDNGVFTIEFDEALSTSKVHLYAQDLVVKNSDGDVLVAGVDYETLVIGDNDEFIQVSLQPTDDAEVEGNYKVYSNSTIKYIQDAEGNEANAFTDSVTLDDLYEELE